MLDTTNYRIRPNAGVDISKVDPDGESSVDVKKEESKDETKKLTKKMDDLQEMLYSEHKHKLLIILQAMDTGGKDGVIRHIFEGVNPAGVRVAHFRVPSQEENDHGFLWRAYARIPGDGEMVVFNRSHYEGVLVERVHNLVPKTVWEGRYEEINEFEKLLTEQNITILKFFLNIDSDEQKKRIEERLKDPAKEWKFSEDDLKERNFWFDYMKAYEDVLRRTSTTFSPWYAVPSNHRWLRDLIISTVIVETLESFDLRRPRLSDKLRQTKIPSLTKK